MKISGERILPASRQQVWDLLNDPWRLARLIPGCEKLDQLAPDEFAGFHASETTRTPVQIVYPQAIHRNEPVFIARRSRRRPGLCGLRGRETNRNEEPQQCRIGNAFHVRRV